MTALTRARCARCVGGLLLAFGSMDLARATQFALGGWFLVLIGLVLIIFMDGCDG